MPLSRKALYLVLLLLVGTFISCQRNGQTKGADNTTTGTTTTTNSPTVEATDTMPVPVPPNPPEITEYSFVLLNNTDGTLGYEVLKSGKVMVSQPNVPGMPGNSGFATKEQASAAATLVIEKLKQGIMPPTLSEKEVKKILKN